jgi:hypothetical protein
MKACTVMLGVLCAVGALSPAAAQATVYQPYSYAQLGGPQARTSSPVGGAYDAALYISAVNPNFVEALEGAPDNFVWTGATKAAGANTFSLAAMSIRETYLVGVGPNGGDIIQLNIFSGNGSPLVPGGTETNGRQPDMLHFHVGAGQKSDPINTNTPQTILGSGMAVFQDGAQVGSSIALFSTVNVGGIGRYAPGGAIDGLGIDEVAMFWEVTPEPATLSILALGGALAFRRRR